MLDTCTERQFVKYVIMNLTGKKSRLQKYYSYKDYYEQKTLNDCRHKESNEENIHSIAEINNLNFEDYIVLKITMEQIMKDLKPLEYQIIKKIYWEGKKVKEVSQEMDIARSSIFRIKKQAYKKIKNFFIDYETFKLRNVF
ncbi:sigma factor-like helix-turn-helix DNA-binding protein [Bacillus bombysepticus]|uniref:sigma factor-like helix-turn-helix DNA-binding protein n=1 Tax=Bacillus bombysepticus TaxID=658666 RepID=UPI0020797DEA|nr:sigma factor-like helix-turn-helix DNA-binding protein [Bacillus bombysepticus]USL11083.1 hypothetical protein LIT24_29725 [Bacillus bombysepticus]